MRAFDMIVLGAGSGNSVIGPGFADWNVALIDDGRWFGGTCLNAGCIPTKMFVRVADVAADGRDADRLGLDMRREPVDWPRIRNRVFAKTDKISGAGLRYRDEKSPNVTVFRDSHRFTDAHTLVGADGASITAPVIVIAAGSRPRPLDAIGADDPALADVVLDSTTIMRIDELPKTLLIVGGGAVAVEFAHVFASLGVEVTVVTRSGRLLRSLDDDVSRVVTELARGYARHVPDATVERITAAPGRAGAEVSLSTGEHLTVDLVLNASGRLPNTDTIDAGAAGFDLEDDGRLVVDAEQRVYAGGTPVDGVWALGDVNSAYQLKHVANHQARIVEHNILHPHDPVGGDPGPVPAAVFGHPQVAHFGLTEAEAPDDAVVISQEYRTTAYGWALEDETSFCKLVVDGATGLILGVHIVGPEASILIQPLVMAAAHGLAVPGLARSQYWPHPAASEVIENALLQAEEQLAARSEGSDAE